MKHLLLFIVSVLFLFSCSDKRTENTNTTIHLDNFENRVYDFSEMAKDVDTLFLSSSVEGAIPIAPVRNICASDSILYVSDLMNTLSAFSLRTGRLLRQLKSMGHASQEYVEISNMVCQGDTLLIVDRRMRKVIRYDASLNYINTMALPFVPLDLMPIESGFLSSRLDAFDRHGRILWLKEDGKVQKEYLPQTIVSETLYSEKTFTWNSTLQRLYVHSDGDNQVYLWDQGELCPVYQLDFPYGQQGKRQKDSPVVRDCFVTTGHVIFSFIFKEKLCYGIYDKDTKVVQAGAFDLNSGRPFAPMSQKGDTLIGVLHADESSVLRNWKPEREDGDLILFKYVF